MGDMLRSDKMTYCDMYLQPETAVEIISRLGEMGHVQFTDMNTDLTVFQKRYISDVCRCAEMERKLRYIESEMARDNIPIPDPIDNPRTMDAHELAAFENTLEKWEEDIMEMADNQTDLLKSHGELAEMYYVLENIGPLLGDAELLGGYNANMMIQGDIGLGGRLFIRTGVVKRSKSFHFETMLFRISRGNIYYRQASVDKNFVNPYTGREDRKVAFLAICQGEQLSNCMQKVFTGFRVESYPCPQTSEERSEKLKKIKRNIIDLEKVLSTTTYHRCKALRAVGKEYQSWMIKVRKTKAVYHTMNMFSLDYTKNLLIGQCWVPEKDFKYIQETLKTCSNEIGTNVPSFVLKTGTRMVPPTFHRTNKFTHGFQALINAYGDSKYGELNPGLYTIITFPFLFALMFGDVGHASILILFATWMLINEKKFMQQKSTNEIWNIFFGGRYIILLLGCFSFYTGFIYNDIFSVHIAINKSYFKNTIKSKEAIMSNEFTSIDPAGATNPPYIYGMDPIWTLATNKIMIENMVKMKISIILGILHMIFGIVLSLINHIHSKDYYRVFLQFLPEILFLCCIFLWLVIMIYYKWFTYGSHYADIKHQAGCAPQILILFIDMMLAKTTKTEEGSECDPYLFEGQGTIQFWLMNLALLCIPVLLLGVPLYINMQNNKRRRKNAEMLTKQTSSVRRFRRSTERREKSHHEIQEMADERDDLTLTELMIHQGVHTIEFVLSTISHTASYLRLWALSLAHAQLSEMLWRMILSKLALADHTLIGIPKLYFVFAVWAGFTLAILVVMEGLSAFLHTLRLHWVEFMSKFYLGEGYPFRPFSFKDILAEEAEKAEPACKIKQNEDRKLRRQSKQRSQAVEF